ncbi:MAG: PAS domain S-box protein [Syntrophomonadaceae bacterium]|jgi:diguanylate cyclase (GGDEF)-like protein/PAS domain S-box-containing protein
MSIPEKTADQNISQHIKLISRIMLAINRSENLDDLFERVLKSTIELLGYNAGLIYILESSTGLARMKCAYGINPDEQDGLDGLSIDAEPYRSVFVSGLPQVWDGHSSPSALNARSKPNPQTEIIIPLLAQGNVYGAICIWGRSKPAFSHAHASILVSIGEILESGMERIKLQEQYREKSRNLENIFNGVEDLIVVFDPFGLILAANQFMQLRLGYSLRELIHTNIFDLCLPQHQTTVRHMIEQTRKGIRACGLLAMTTRYGNSLEIESCFSLAQWSGEEVFIGISRDVSDLRRQEKEIADINASYERLTNCAGEAIYRLKLDDMCMSYVNPAALAISGHHMEEWLYRPGFMMTLLHPESRPIFCSVIKALQSGQKVTAPIALQWIDPQGVVRTLEHTFVLVTEHRNQTQYVECIARDLTAQRSAEEALRKSEERYALVMDGVRDGIWDWDLSSGELYLSQGFFDMIDYSYSRISFGHLWEHIHSDDHEKVRIMYQQYQNGKMLRQEVEHRMIKSDGSWLWVLNRGKAIQNDSGKVVRIVGSIIDISDRKHMEEALRASETRYRMVVEEQTELIYRFSTGGRITFVNDAVCYCFKREKAAMIGQLITADILAEDMYKLHNSLQHIDKNHPISTIEHQVRLPDGRIRWQQWTIRAIFTLYGDITEYQAVGRDITESKRLEETLKYLSMHDPLTGMYNRGYFDEQMKLISGVEEFFPAGIIICDIDDLKLINDQHGHKAGDDLIKLAASVLKACAPYPQVAARIGGDEFAIIIPNTCSEALQKQCDRIKNEIIQRNRINPGSIRLSMSIGYALKSVPGQDMESTFIEADDMMYVKKAAYSLRASQSHNH